MFLRKLPVGGVFLAFGVWVLAAGPVSAQGPVSPGFSPTFGVTGLGTGPYGMMPHLSLGISGGGGGNGNGSSGVYNRFGRLKSLADQEPQSLLEGPGLREDVAQLRVIVPTRDAELWVNDTLMKKQGKSRSFISPFLVPDKHFIYDLKVRYKDSEGRIVEMSRSIRVHAGSQDVVDFTRSDDSSRSLSRPGQERGLSSRQ